MSKPLIYLCGPITGLSYDNTTDWRQLAMDYLDQNGMIGLSPMRAKSYLKDVQHVSDSYESILLSSQRGIYARDKFDCHRCDAVIVNFLGSNNVSIGSVMEIAWAAARNIPIILIMKDGNIHEHCMIREACPFRVETLDEALDLTRVILMPGKTA